MRTFQPPPHIALSLVGSSSLRTARLAVTGLVAVEPCAEWHADAALVVTELVTNALGECGECQLSAWYLAEASALRVEVMDASPNMPIEQGAGSARVGGHGLRIVGKLSTRWGVTTHEDGKTVWFEIDG